MIDHRTTVADLGHGIYLGHKDMCQVGMANRTLHIYRTDYPSYSCDIITRNEVNKNDMVFEYRDGESLKKWNIDLSEVYNFFLGDDSLYIHCAVGQTRGPTLAIIAIMARASVSPFLAAARVLKGNWIQRRIVSNFCITPMQEIFEWWETSVK